MPHRQRASAREPTKKASAARALGAYRHWHDARISLCSQTSHWGAVMTKALQAACVAVILILCAPVSAGATSRIKDLANIEGVRQNQLIGYGLVVGLNGTGDTLNNVPFTKQSLTAMLERLGVNVRGATMRTGNVAAVMVTANLPAFGTQGTRIDITVSALGDSKSLQGGTLLVTPLLGADGNVYAVGQGSVAINGFQAEGEAAKITRGVPTVQVNVPKQYAGNVVSLLTEIEQLQIEPDLAARIVIDERSGIIVMGRDVRVSTVAVAQGNLTVTISETPQVSQPAPFSRGQTRTVPRTKIGVQEDGKKFAVVREGVSLQQLVDGLNALGIGPRDLIAILQAIKAAGAIQAEIEVM